MGAEFYGYYVPYEADVESALQKLRQREFAAGRYHAAYGRDRYENGDYDIDCLWPPSKISIIDDSNIHELLLSSPAHSSIEEAVEDAMEESTKSALDLRNVSHDEYDEHFGVAYMLKPEELIKFMGTDKPDREQFEKGFWDYTEYMTDCGREIRYTGYCVIIYKDEQPSELFFGGWSAD